MGQVPPSPQQWILKADLMKPRVLWLLGAGEISWAWEGSQGRQGCSSVPRSPALKVHRVTSEPESDRHRDREREAERAGLGGGLTGQVEKEILGDAGSGGRWRSRGRKDRDEDRDGERREGEKKGAEPCWPGNGEKMEMRRVTNWEGGKQKENTQKTETDKNMDMHKHGCERLCACGCTHTHTQSFWSLSRPIAAPAFVSPSP